MTRLRRVLFQVALFAVTPLFANAATPDAVLGRWIEKFPNGNGIVTEFTATQMLSYNVNSAGNRQKDLGQFPVTYKDLSPTSVGVDFKGGGGIMLVVKDTKTILMDFPGMGAHTLTRVENH